MSMAQMMRAAGIAALSPDPGRSTTSGRNPSPGSALDPEDRRFVCYRIQIHLNSNSSLRQGWLRWDVSTWLRNSIPLPSARQRRKPTFQKTGRPDPAARGEFLSEFTSDAETGDSLPRPGISWPENPFAIRESSLAVARTGTLRVFIVGDFVSATSQAGASTTPQPTQRRPPGSQSRRSRPGRFSRSCWRLGRRRRRGVVERQVSNIRPDST